MMKLPTAVSEAQATHLLGILPSTVIIHGSSKEAEVVWFISPFLTFMLLIPNILEQFCSPISAYLKSFTGKAVKLDIRKENTFRWFQSVTTLHTGHIK